MHSADRAHLWGDENGDSRANQLQVDAEGIHARSRVGAAEAARVCCEQGAPCAAQPQSANSCRLAACLQLMSAQAGRAPPPSYTLQGGSTHLQS